MQANPDRARDAVQIRVGTLALEPQNDVRYGAVTDADVGDDGLIYLLTRAPGAVLVHRPTGEYVGSWNVSDFVHPHGLTIHGDTVYIVDQYAHDVRIFTTAGRQLAVLGTTGQPSDTGCDWSLPAYKDKYLSIRRGGPPFNNPTKLAVAPDGSMYVSDGYGNSRVHRFSADGTLLASWGEPGSGPGEFRNPHGLCVTANWRVLVADRENDRIQEFDRDGTFIDSWTDVQRPAGLVELDDGNLLVGELGWPAGSHSFVHGTFDRDVPSRLAILDPSGTVLARTLLDGIGSFGDRPISPHGLSRARDGLVYIANLFGSHADPMITVTVDRG